MRTGVGVVVALLAGCTVTQVKPCADDPTVCAPEAWCNPVTQLCERQPPDLGMVDLAMRDIAVCKVGFISGAAVTLATGQTTSKLAIADLNLDKLGDLLFLEPTLDKFTVILGKSGGGFAPAVPYAAANVPHSMAIADFDDDGKLDVAVLGQTTAPAGIFQVRTGVGDGTLNAAQLLTPNTGGSYSEILAGKYSGTKYQDLVALNGANSLLLLKNGGALTFAKSTVSYVGATAQRLAQGDVNGDGYPDVLATRASGANSFVTVTYGGPAPLSTFSDTLAKVAAFIDLATIDVNGDGRDDAVAIEAGGGVHVWYGQAQGAPIDSKMPISVGSGLNQLITADFDGDGYGDVAVMGKSTPDVYVYFGSSAGLRLMPLQVPVGSFPNNDIAVGDVNGDGRPDFVLVKGSTPLQLFPIIATCM